MQSRDSDDLGDLWPSARLDDAARQRLLDHAALLGDQGAVQSVFDASAEPLDDLQRQRLLRHAGRLGAARQGWPWRPALWAVAATLLAVVGAGHWPVAKPRGSAGVSAPAAPGGATQPPASATAAEVAELDATAELAAALPGLAEFEEAGEEREAESAALELNDDEGALDVGAGLDALHGLQGDGMEDNSTLPVL